MQLVASMWGAAGERTRSDIEARALCTMLSAVYTASELFMLTDFSAGELQAALPHFLPAWVSHLLHRFVYKHRGHVCSIWLL